MKYLFPHWEKIEKIFCRKNLFLFLDYDGTLSPIVDNPDKAFIPKKTKDILKKIAELNNMKLAIISGRALKDIKRKAGVKKIIYAGNHGFEISGTKAKPKIHGIDEYMSMIKKIKPKLEKKLLKIEGAIIEDKDISLTFHYRMMKSEDAVYARKIFRKLLKEYIDKDKIKIKPGKKVLEIRPYVNWNKGKIVSFILKEAELESFSNKYFPIYVGDDTTDEDAFRVLKKKGLCIRIGRSQKSLADYYLKNTSETAALLQMFFNLKKAEIDGRA